MLNHVFVPNTLICTEPGGTIEWDKLMPYVEQNFAYDENLVAELEQYNQIRAPYREILELILPFQLHQYYIVTEATTVTFPDTGSEEPDQLSIPANSILLRWKVTNGSSKDYLVLSRSQTFFQYQPLDNGFTYNYSWYDPSIDKLYLRPLGEWPINDQRLLFNSNRAVVTNKISYTFSAPNTRRIMKSPVYFNADKVCVRLYLTATSDECILTCPAHYDVQIDTTGNHTITLILDTNVTLPSQFYIEVF